MNPIDLKLYVYALYILMVISTFSFVLIIRKMESDTVPKISLRYFNAYFILGVIGWIGLGIKDSANIDIDLTITIFIFILASGLLLIAIAEYEKLDHSKRIILIIVHICIAASSLLLNNDPQRFIFMAAYNAIFYPCISYISFRLARKKQNLGHAIISVAALIVVVIIPFQFYNVLVLNNLSMVYGLTLTGSSTGYILVGIGFITTVMISENKKMKNLALHDPLTGLYNRRGMDFSLNHIISAAHRTGGSISAINIDIDFFKNVNDTYGHDAGDFVLKNFSDTLLKSIRPNDVCCRVGGEEFVIVLPETSLEYAIQVAERIRLDIQALELTYLNKTITITSSFGVSSHRKNVDIDYLLKDADKALYAAKAEGRNKVCVENSE
jgi:diguanylate cyclase (GGDEF)-like protein